MIRPTKHSDPRLTVLPVAALLTKELRKKRVASLSELRAATRKHSRAYEDLFSPSLTLLFGLGLIEYRKKTDSFEYCGGR